MLTSGDHLCHVSRDSVTYVVTTSHGSTWCLYNPTPPNVQWSQQFPNLSSWHLLRPLSSKLAASLPRPAPGRAQQIQSFINIDLYINSAQGTLTRALNLYWNYILHFMGHLNLCHSIKFSSHSCPHLDWTELEAWQICCGEGGCKCSFNSELRWLLLSPELDIHVLHIMRLSCHQERWRNAQEAEFQTWTFKLNAGNY